MSAPPSLHIDWLSLRVPGLDEHDARILVGEIAAAIADHLGPEARLRDLSALDARITIPPDTPRTQMAARIAAAIVDGLGTEGRRHD